METVISTAKSTKHPKHLIPVQRIDRACRTDRYPDLTTT